jgi:phosphoribosylglycinamide formyltransferase-1
MRVAHSERHPTSTLHPLPLDSLQVPFRIPSDAQHPLPLAVLVSGAGTNLQALLDTVHGHEAEIVAVASNAVGAPALARADTNAVPTAVFARSEYPDRPARDAAMADWLQERGAQLVVLAGYMELIDPAFLERFPNAVINVHPSLLPAFPGLRAVQQALDYGVKVFGVTVHFVDASVDSGPVILQGSVTLPHAHDADEVLGALRPLEHTLLPEAVRLFANGNLTIDPANPRRVILGADPHEQSDPVDTL